MGRIASSVRKVCFDAINPAIYQDLIIRQAGHTSSGILLLYMSVMTCTMLMALAVVISCRAWLLAEHGS